MHTPWGQSDYSKKITRGIINYSTPSHGGLHVSAKLNEIIPEPFRNKNGWYEEDCEWAIVVATFPQYFKGEYDHAIATLKQYYPEKWEAVSGCKVRGADSRKVRQIEYLTSNPDAHVVTCAFGDWHERVPKGYVGVCTINATDYLNTRVHWRNDLYNAKPTEYWYLVPDENYVKNDASLFACREGEYMKINPIN